MPSRFLTHGFRPRDLLGVALLSLCLGAVAAPKTGKAPANPVATQLAEAAPVSRLIIRYRTGIKLGTAAVAAGATERAQAAAQMERSANLAGEGRMHYLKSVSSSLHVAALDQPMPAAEAQALMQRLRSDPAVLDVMVDQRVKPHLVPNDPLFTSGEQWHLQSPDVVVGGLNAPSAWDRSTGAGVVIAVLDDGYTTHADLVPNLVSNILPGYDFVSADNPAKYGGNAFWTANDGNARDPVALDPGNWVTTADVEAKYCDEATPQSTWHGSHVAGLAAAAGNNGKSGLGVAFNAKILPVRVLGRCGGYVSDVLAGARWAVGLAVPDVPGNPNPARILNLSLGFSAACDAETQRVLDEVRALNVSIVASAGNDFSTVISVPANCLGVFAVTAHTREGDNADYANVGTGVRISAAGGGPNTVFPSPFGVQRAIRSTGNAGLTVPTSDADLLLQGTSMAAPQVAGVLALLAAARPDLSMQALESLVVGSARAFPAGSYCAENPQGLPAGFCGSGLLDANAALLAALGIAPPAPSAGGGGGCTAAPHGQADASLLLLALSALGLAVWRRRR